MSKVLVLASVASMIDQFNMPFVKLLIDMGYEVDVACNFKEGNNCSEQKISELSKSLEELGVRRYQIDFSRSVLNLKGNLSAYKQVKALLNSEKYAFVHCHSPIGGAVCRLAAKKAKTRVIYTAHGFHFYKGAPLKNWIIYYSVEWLCAHWTDTLITINKEDYELAKRKMHAKNVVYVPGIGIDLDRFGSQSVDKSAKRRELGVPTDACLLISVGELNDNKNHETVIKALEGMDVYYIIAGIGEKREYLQSLIDGQGMTDRIKLLGFRSDARELYAVSDAFVFPSFREGLSVSLMEAMASGLPCVVSKIRGNTDLVDENGGALFEPHDADSVRAAINEVLTGERESMGRYNKEKIKTFGIEPVIEQMRRIYDTMK